MVENDVVAEVTLFSEHGYNTGIVNFENRADAEHAKLGLQGQNLFDFPMRIDWMRSNGSNVVAQAHGTGGGGANSSGVGSGKRRSDLRHSLSQQQNKFSSGYGYSSDESISSVTPAMWSQESQQRYQTIQPSTHHVTNSINSPVMSIHIKFYAAMVKL